MAETEDCPAMPAKRSRTRSSDWTGRALGVATVVGAAGMGLIIYAGGMSFHDLAPLCMIGGGLAYTTFNYRASRRPLDLSWLEEHDLPGSPEDRYATAASIIADARRKLRLSNWFRGVVGVAGAAVVASEVLNLRFHNRLFGDVLYMATAVALYGGACLDALARRRASRELLQLNNPDAVGPLLDVLRYAGDVYLHRLTRVALIRSLPQLGPEDAGLLTAPQLRTLFMSLRTSTEVEEHDANSPAFALAALQALEHVGDASCLPSVEAFAVDPRTPPDLRDAAGRCLATLRPRAEAERKRGTLLRPAEDASSTLLRPAASASQPVDALLRAEAAGDR